MDMICEVLRVIRFDFLDENTGRKVKGCKITYIDGTTVCKDNYAGLVLHDVSADYEVFEQLKGIVPGEVELQFRLVPMRNGVKIHVEKANKIVKAVI